MPARGYEFYLRVLKQSADSYSPLPGLYTQSDVGLVFGLWTSPSETLPDFFSAKSLSYIYMSHAVSCVERKKLDIVTATTLNPSGIFLYRGS